MFFSESLNFVLPTKFHISFSGTTSENSEETLSEGSHSELSEFWTCVEEFVYSFGARNEEENELTVEVRDRE